MTTSNNDLPFRAWWPIIAGVLAGIALRFVFSGHAGEPYATMMGAFIYGAPIVVGMVTVYIAERMARRSWGYYFLAPLLANALFVIGTLLILIEGWICAILIIPLFALAGGISGLIMGGICRLMDRPGKALYGFTALPLILGGFNTDNTPPELIDTVERSIVIRAEPAAVWHEIHNARNIRPDEVGTAWAYRIGVPFPESGVTRRTPDGRVRNIEMGKGIHFDQVVVDWKEDRHVRWNYRFHPDSFPPDALDHHVSIGGHYFDINSTSYTLSPTDTGTRLHIKMQYRVSTQFNWYAARLARLLFGNFEEVILEFYRMRSENRRTTHGTPAGRDNPATALRALSAPG